MAQPSPPDEVGNVPVWIIVLLGVAWAAIAAGMVAYVGGAELFSP